MDNQVAQALTIIGGIISLLILIGAAVALVRGSYSKARMVALREDNDDLRKRFDDCQAALERTEAREAVLIAKVDHLASENDMMSQLVTQRANVDEVLNELQRHHVMAMGKFDELIAAIGGTRA